jgi:hypothetical protein
MLFMRILNKWSILGLVLMLLAVSAAQAAPKGYELLFSSARNVAALSNADRQAIYGQLGLKVGPDGKTLEFADPGCPPLQPDGGDIQVNTEDLNGDQHPEVFVSLGSTCMFGSAGMGVYLLTRDDTGHWKSHNLGTGMYVVQETLHQGYADVMIGGPGFCQPVLRWDGNTYVFDRNVAEQPGGCDGR